MSLDRARGEAAPGEAGGPGPGDRPEGAGHGGADDALGRLYARRFDDRDRAWKVALWRVIWEELVSRWVPPDACLLDLGAGGCELINAAVARRRIAVDLGPDLERRAGPGVEAHRASCDDLSFLAAGEVDVVFSSNFLEHLPDKDAVLRVLAEARRVLRPGGRIVLIGPNVRFLPDLYWDYFDHHVPLSDRSLAEALEVAGLEVEQVVPRLLPYTIKSRLPRATWLVRAYLRLGRLTGPLLGKQFLLVARR